MSREMLFSTINSDFSQKLFEILYVKNVFQKMNLYYTPNFLKCCQTTCCLSIDKLRFLPEIICNSTCVKKVFQKMNIFLLLIFSNGVKTTCCCRTINSDFWETSLVMLYVKNDCKHVLIFTPNFLELCLAKYCLVLINTDFTQKSFVMSV